MNVPVTERIPTFPGKTLAVIDDRLYTAEELLETSRDTSRVYELKKGILTIMSPAGSDHGDLAMGIGARMRVHAEDNNLGVVFAAETGFRLETDPDTVLAPDVGFVAKHRLPEGRLPKGFFPGPPDLAVEVVSPGDRASEVQEKVQDWLAFGVALVWIVEPRTRTVAIYRADGSATVLDESATLDGEDILPDFAIKLSALFR